MKQAKFLIVSLISFLLFQSTVNSGTADIATLAPSSAVILTGTLQPLTFSATNDKPFDIKTYHAEFSFTPGLTITDIATTPPAATATIDSRKNLIIFEWSAVGQGATVTANFNVSASPQGTYSINPGSIYYTDYNRNTYTASCNGSEISVRDELVAPASPGNIRSLSGDGYVRIYWDRSADLDVTGYRIYRRTAATEFVNIGQVTDSPFNDAAAEDGTTYYYRVTAVDRSGNESELSGQTSEMYTKLLVQTYAIPGASIAAVGDINGDGKPDVAVGDPTYDAGKGGNVLYDIGKVDIYYGGNTTGVPDVTLVGEAGGDQFGQALAIVDMNNDGYDELIVGAPFYDADVTYPVAGTAKDAGKVYVYAGGAAFNTTPAYSLEGRMPSCGVDCYYVYSEELGSSIAAAGDVNNDGYQDVVIGAPQGGYKRSGSIRVLYGSPGLASLGTVEMSGPSESANLGYPVSSAGDVNGDGYADMIVGSGSVKGGSKGVAYLVYGGFVYIGATLRSGVPGDGFGRIFAPMGDINGDGYSDFAVNRNIYYGGPSADTIVDRILPDAPDFLSSLGDVNQDGFKDILVSPGPRVYFGGSFAEYVPDIPREGMMKILATADTDKDGVKEIMVGADLNGVYLYSLAPYLSHNLPSVTVTAPKNNFSTNRAT